MSTNICITTSTTLRKGQTDVVSPETVDRNVKMLLTTQMMENFESNSDQTTHLANNSTEAKRETEAAHNRTTDGGWVRKTQEKERTRKAMAKKNLKEKRGQEEEERLESEAKKARIIQAEEERKQQDTLTVEEGQLEADDAVQTPSPVNESQEPEDDEACLPGNLSSHPSSPLLTAHFIENINEVAYPEGIKGPKVELNANVRDARFRYDRDFLLQFMHICKLKPPTLLPTLGALGIEPVDQCSFAIDRGSSGCHRNASSAMPVSANRQASVGLGIGGFQKSSVPSGFQMGNFQSPGSKLTSEGRFAMSNPRSASTSSATSQFRSLMVHTPSNRIRSKRGEKRGDANKTPMSQQEYGSGYGAAPILGAGFEPVVPLEISANRWVPASTTRKVQPDVDSP
ncbi:hypothetical protein EDD22DRAFT_102200 [Suillus occidentalis]|nr:hypothetical protein EDD22DRAFT_102200 [Suillus occidentalis]